MIASMLRVSVVKKIYQPLTIYLVVSAFLCAVGFLAYKATVSAATGQVANGFLISPVRNELTIKKGQSQTLDITVQNPTNVPTVAKAVVNDFLASSDESGNPRLILDSSTPPPHNDFRTLVSPIPDISLGPQEKKDVKVTLLVPAGASAGGYYGAIRFVPSSPGQQSTVGLTASVGSLVLITVPGNLVQKLNLVQFSAAQGSHARSIIFTGNVSVLTRLQNAGDIHVQPFSNVLVKDMFGKLVTSYEFNNTDPRANILPDSTRKFVDALPKRHWFGRYTITASFAYSQGSGNLLNASATFWYFPLWFVAAVALFIVLVISLIYYVLARRKRPRRARRP